MLFLRASVLVVLLVGNISAASSPAETTATQRVRAHVTFLADDLLEGRAAGTRGHELAAAYVASQFAAAGLVPKGVDNSYRQPVQLVESTRDFANARFIVRAPNEPEVALEPLNDFLIAPVPGREFAELAAPAVFVGFGVHAPEQGYSDFAGVDLQGKIAVLFFGAPASLPGTARAHYSDRDTKAQELARRGAIALITVNPPFEETRRPWGTVLAGSRFPAMTLLGTDGQLVDVVAQIAIGGSVSPSGAAKLFARSPRPFHEAVAAASRNEPQNFPLGIELSLAARATQRPVASHNVLAALPGTDSALAHDYVVITSHLDHLGIGAAVNGDTIYNGAIDNAIGVASLLAAAQHLAENKIVTRRPLLFAAVTAQEKGLLGARHLSRNPPAGGRFAANLNVDAGPFFAPLRAAIGMGKEHTTLGPLFEAVARRLDWAIRPDPRPEERRFVRSDQYSFVLEGVPALRVLAAPESTDPAIDLAAIDRVYWRDRYHKPNDDLQHPIHFESAGAFAILLAEVARAAADAEQPPAWLPGDFFGDRFGPK